MSSFQAASALGQATGFYENERAKRGDGRLGGRGRLRSDIAAVIEKDRRSAFVFERVTRGFSPHLASVCVLLVGLDIDRCRILAEFISDCTASPYGVSSDTNMPLRTPVPYCRVLLQDNTVLLPAFPITRGLACISCRGYPEGTATPPAVEMPSFRPYLGGLGHLHRRYMLAVFSYSPRQP
jgi:hypothetical protein